MTSSVDIIANYFIVYYFFQNPYYSSFIYELYQKYNY